VIFLDFDEVKQKVLDNKKMIFILLVLFIFAVGIRSNIARYEGNYLFEPDAYYHARTTQYLVTDGVVPEIDPQAYYQEEQGGSTSEKTSFYWILSAWIYTIVSLGMGFNKELFAFTIQFFPAIFGALISVGMYFLGKEIFNDKKIGLITGFAAAVTPAFAYRTMAGAQGNNSLGFLWMVIGFIFLVRAIKHGKLGKEEWINIILSGVFFAVMVFSWRMHILIPAILLPSAAFILLQLSSKPKKHNENITKSEPFNFIIKIFVSLGIYTVASIIYGEAWLTDIIFYASKFVGSNELALILGVISVLVFIALSFLIYNSSKDTKKIAQYLVIIGLFAGLFALLFMFTTVPDFFYGEDGRTQLSSMVGEENTGKQFFGTKYNSLILFPWIALFMLPIGLYFFRKKESHPQIIFWFWTIITLFMAWYKLKFTFVFGLGIVTGVAITAYLVFELLKKFELEKGIEAKISLGALLVLIILGVGAAGIFMPDYQPSANSSPDWVEAMEWIQINTEDDAKLFNWWGEGHMISFITERRVSSDNRNFTFRANQAYAEFNITGDANRAYDIVKNEIGADYVLLPANNFKAMTNYHIQLINKVDYTEAQKYYNDPFNKVNCQTVETGRDCGGQIIPTEQLSEFNTIWTTKPTQFIDGETPAYYYLTEKSVFVLGPILNNTNLSKVYFNNPETEGFYDLVFENHSIRIYKIN
jgi:asparagine N-glycosylation enzyme membrane subunit Stt3